MVMVLAVGDSVGTVGAVSPEASSWTRTDVAHAKLFLLVPSSGGTYKPREDSGGIHRPPRPPRPPRPQSNPEAPAQQSLLKPPSISHPSVVPVSLDRTETPESGPPSITTTKIILESRRSSPGGPFSPGTTHWCQACLGGQRATQSGGQLLPLEAWRDSPFLKMALTVCEMG